jgi:hypothetical protein
MEFVSLASSFFLFVKGISGQRGSMTWRRRIRGLRSSAMSE